SVTVLARVVPGGTMPNDRAVGAANRSGTSARGMSAMPPPSRVAGASFAPTLAGSPVCTSADLIWSTVHVGCRCLSSAAAPAIPGEAMLVPSSVPNLFPGDRDERTPIPGAETSGLNWSETGVGPAEEKYAILFAPSTAATAIAPRAFAGEPTEPNPFTSK